MQISVIITTYNRPDALERVLQALLQQTDRAFEIIVADDGSCDDTTTLLNQFAHPIKHIWQEDEGFRAARIRNLAVKAAAGDYIIFLDGDCVVLPTFVARHRRLAETGFFVAGNRVLLSESFTKTVLQDQLAIDQASWVALFRYRVGGQINRLLPLLHLPLGPLRKLNSDAYHGVKTCNVALWRQDFLAVNGFDEAYVGWGYEDSDLIVRMLRNGVRRKLGRCSVPVLHLWHPDNDRSHAEQNLQRLHECKKIWADDGVVKSTSQDTSHFEA